MQQLIHCVMCVAVAYAEDPEQQPMPPSQIVLWDGTIYCARHAGEIVNLQAEPVLAPVVENVRRRGLFGR